MRHIHKIKIFITAIACSMFLLSCDKYLEVTPKGYTLLTTVTKYDQWLNGPDRYFYTPIQSLLYPTDLYDVASPQLPATTPSLLSYSWAEQFSTTTADLWKFQYDVISGYNSLILGIDEATGGTDRERASLKAEALLGRAYEYFYLINEYGKSYDSATADKDPGVPIIKSDDVAQKTPPRSSVKEVYDFIISDLTAAIPHLPENNYKNRFRGSKAAGYAVMARVYFYARNYAKASEFAQLALDHSAGSKIIDFTTISSSTTQIPILSLRPDAIYARHFTITTDPTQSFLRTFDINDQRLKLFYYNILNYTFPIRGFTKYNYGGATGGVVENLAPTMQEMVLIIAEVAARQNNLPVALERLNELRKNRIPAADYIPYQSNDQETVIKRVLQERTFEFPFNGLRWFDMRRLNFENRMPAVVRTNGANVPFATLEPGSPRYTFQIPQFVMQFNPGMVQNP